MLSYKPSISILLLLFFIIYIFPPIIHRIHQYFYPIEEGISYLVGSEYSPWWGSHQLQVFYSTFPMFEQLLLFFPGAFSLWLRLWGAKIGKNIYWTSGIQVVDRSLLIVGDNVIFGGQVTICSHIIKPRRNNLLLYVKTIEIGNNVFLGARSSIGAGSKIPDNEYIPFAQQIYPKNRLSYQK